jgi:uncharacterized protein (DUF924 family)
MEARTPQDVLEVWFGRHENPADAVAAKWPQWFGKSEEIDAMLREALLPLTHAARLGTLDAWQDTPEGLVALVLLTDQLPRNLFRGTAGMYEADRKALGLARKAVAQPWFTTSPFLWRAFVALPFEHSEDVVDQFTAVGLMAALRRTPPAGLETMSQEFFAYALKHLEVVERFGRFPHRNAILGRASTPSELEYLAQPGSGF